MIFLSVLLAIFVLITLVLLTNITVKIEYNNELFLGLYFGIIKIPLHWFTKEKKSNKKSKKQANNSKKRTNNFLEKVKKNGYKKTFEETTKLAKSTFVELGKFLAKIKIIPFKFKLIMVGNDAAKLAIEYGEFCALYYPIVGSISNVAKCKNIESQIFVDYVQKDAEFYFETAISFKLINALTSAVKIIKEFVDFKSKFDNERTKNHE